MGGILCLSVLAIGSSYAQENDSIKKYVLNEVMISAAKHKSRFRWLEPPASLGPLTIADVEAACGADEHIAVVRNWANQMWEVWSPYHQAVRTWASAQS